MSQSVDKLLRKAQRHANARQVNQAEEIFKLILSKFPKNKKAIQGLKEIRRPPQSEVKKLINFYNTGRLPENSYAGRQSCGPVPWSTEIYEILGAAALGLENYKLSIKYYERLLEVEPKHADALNNSAMNFYKLDEYEKAIEFYNRTLEIEPKFADAHYNLGNVFAKVDRLGEAIESYLSSLAINPNDIEVLFNYGTALNNYGKFDQAIEIFNKLLQMGLDTTEIRIEINIALEQKKEVGRLLEIYHKESKNDRGSVESLFFRGTIFEKNSFNELAVDIYKKGHKIKT